MRSSATAPSTGGVAYEALNNIGTSGANVLIVLNDNGRSYAPTVSRLASGCPREPAARRAPAGADDRQLAGERLLRSTRPRYLGPVDGHDLGALEPALQLAAACHGPVVLHVHTVKGRGYVPAERDEEKCLHDVGAVSIPRTGVALGARTPPG